MWYRAFRFRLACFLNSRNPSHVDAPGNQEGQSM